MVDWTAMTVRRDGWSRIIGTVLCAALTAASVEAADPPAGSDPADGFSKVMRKMSAQKAEVMKAAAVLLETRYDMTDRPATGIAMTGGKPVQEGIRIKLPPGVTWESLSASSPEKIREQGVYPAGFLPLPHANHPEGGMAFPRFHIDEIKQQTGRDLERFDLDFEIPDHFLPEFPPPIFLTTRTDLGDVSRGKVVTLENFHELFKAILNPKQLEGLRLLLTPFPQRQFNATDERRSRRPSLGVTCLDCHVNGHTNGAAHLAGDTRPQEFRHRIETPSLRGVNVQRLFGSQRALKSVEDFTEFEQRAAYFDGDPMQAAQKGLNVLERGSQVHFMSEFQALLDFPPAPKLDWDGKLDPALGNPAELRGQALFFGKARCATCHTPPYYTDNLMHNLRSERFYNPVTIAGMRAAGDGPIKTFPLRGIKDSPPYLHDGRLLTLDDTVEFFNLVLGLKLDTAEKLDLVAFLRVL